MPGKEVDGTALAVFGVRDLRDNLPAKTFETRDNALGKACMPAIEEPIQLATTPSNVDDDFRIERAEQVAQGSNGQPVESATLDSRHHVVADAGAIGRVDLADAKSMAQGTRRAADLKVIHGPKSSQFALTRQ